MTHNVTFISSATLNGESTNVDVAALQSEVDAAEIEILNLQNNKASQTEIDAAIATREAAQVAVDEAQNSAQTAQDVAIAANTAHAANADKHVTALDKADFHKPVTLSATSHPGASIDPDTQELDIPPAEAPETKDSAPTAGSAVAVESQGILAALDALNWAQTITHDKANQKFVVTDRAGLATDVPFAIVDDLLSTDTLVPLSANQGRVLRLLVEGIGERKTVDDQAAMAADAGPVGQSYYVKDDDGTAAGNWAMYIRTATAPNVDEKTLSKADIVGAFTLLLDPVVLGEADNDAGLISKQFMFDREQAHKGTEAYADPAHAMHSVAKSWDAETLLKAFDKKWTEGVAGQTVNAGERVEFSGGISNAAISTPTAAGLVVAVSNRDPIVNGSTITLSVSIFRHGNGTVVNSWALFPGNTLYAYSVANGPNFFWVPYTFEKSLITPAFTNGRFQTINTQHYKLSSLRGATPATHAIKVPVAPWGSNKYVFTGETTGTVRFIAAGEGDHENPSGSTFRMNGGNVSHLDFEFDGKPGHLRFSTDENGKWYYVRHPGGDGALNKPAVPLPADNKPIAWEPMLVTADRALDLSDVPATAGIYYYIELAKDSDLSVPNIGIIAHEAENNEIIHFRSTGVAGEVERVGNPDLAAPSSEFFQVLTLNQAAVLWTVPETREYVIEENMHTSTNNSLLTTITNTTAGGEPYTSNLSRLTTADPSNTATIALTKGDVLSIKALSGGGTTSGSHKVRIRPVGAVSIDTSFTVPTKKTATITAASGNSSLDVYDEFFTKATVAVTAGNQLVLGAVTDATVALIPGTVDTFQMTSVGANPAVTFTEELVPVEKKPKSILTRANAGVQVAVEGMSFTMATSGQRQVMVRNNDGANAITWTREWNGGEGDYYYATTNLSTSWVRLTGYAFTAVGHEDRLTIVRNSTGELWHVRAKVGSGFNNNIFRIDYFPNS